MRVILLPPSYTNELYRKVKVLESKLLIGGYEKDIGYGIDDRVFWGDTEY
jgi:hypothetical protein